ncbi:MAG: hypothetical protein R3E88_12825 [Myxococcota bacterium]
MHGGSTASGTPDDSDGSDARARRAAALALALVVVGAACLLAGWLDAPLHRPQDEGQLLVLPELVRGGAVLHRDVFATYPPGVFWLLAAVYELVGPSLAAERATGLALRLAIVAATFALARRSGVWVATAASAAAALVLLPLQLAAFAWLGAVALGLGALVALHGAPRAPARAAVAGALAGAALAFRLDVALALALGAAPCLVRAPRAARGAFAAGLALGALPLAAHALAAGVGAFVDATVVETVVRVAPNRRLSLGDASLVRLRELALPVLGIVSVLAAARGASRTPARDGALDERARLASLGGFAAGLAPQALQRLDADHVLYVACVASPLVLVALGSALARRSARVAAATVGVAFAALFAAPRAALVVDLARGTGPARGFALERGGRRVVVTSEVERATVAELVAAIERASRPGDALFVGPRDLTRTYYADVQIYWLFPELRPASFFVDLNPGSADRPGSRLAGDLARADLVVASRRWDAMRGESEWAGSPDAARVLAERFALRFERGPWSLWTRRAAGAETAP